MEIAKEFIGFTPVPLLDIENLTVSTEGKVILKSLTLRIYDNEIHLLLGPNGSGKSTLAKVLIGHPAYTIEEGRIFYCGIDLVNTPPEKRSLQGIFASFQDPPTISGLSNFDLLRNSYNEKQKKLKRLEKDPLAFMEFIQKFLIDLQISQEFLNRSFNEGFSGGEKKRNEILQFLILEPKIIILDEIDSGLDRDAVELIYHLLKKHRKNDASLLIITHSPNILRYISPTHVHVLQKGQITKTGDISLVHEIQEKGYEKIV
ncbi:MAG: Fe-S cluster assembly ATPase SufC [Pedobacter sp.]|nr:MAG: Fe-S cluster assembly ATPase SufC [Pedobacter sp.]